MVLVNSLTFKVPWGDGGRVWGTIGGVSCCRERGKAELGPDDCLASAELVLSISDVSGTNLHVSSSGQELWSYCLRWDSCSTRVGASGAGPGQCSGLHGSTSGAGWGRSSRFSTLTPACSAAAELEEREGCAVSAGASRGLRGWCSPRSPCEDEPREQRLSPAGGGWGSPRGPWQTPSPSRSLPLPPVLPFREARSPSSGWSWDWRGSCFIPNGSKGGCKTPVAVCSERQRCQASKGLFRSNRWLKLELTLESQSDFPLLCLPRKTVAFGCKAKGAQSLGSYCVVW